MIMLLASILVLAISGPAHADPIITPLVGGLLGSAIAGTVVVGSVTVGAIVTGAVEIGLAFGASLLLTPKRKTKQDPSVPQSPSLQSVSPQSISPRYYAAGRIMGGGIRHWFEAPDGLHMIVGIVLNCEPIDGVEQYIVDGEIIGAVSYGQFAMLSAYVNGTVITVDAGPNVFWPTGGLKSQLMYAEVWDPAKFQFVQKPMGVMPAMAFDFRNGLPAGNPSTLAQYFLPSLYSSANKCSNLACLYAMAVGGRVIYNRMAVYPKAWPDITTVFRGARVYDPRDPAQSFSDPNTWVWSRNSALVLAWYMTHPDGGRIPYAKMKWATWAAEADYCDRPVPIFPTGTEPFARTDVQWHTGEAVRDVMARLQAACDATVWEDGDGLWNIWIAKDLAPTVVLTDADISSITIEEGSGALAQFNSLTPSYMEPRENYQVIPAAPVTDDASIATVGERPETISFKEVASFNQSHRLAWRALKRNNPALKATITGGPSLLRCVGELVVSVNSAAAAINGTFRFAARANVSQHLEQITLSLALVSAHDYDDAVPPYDPVSPYETSVTPPPLPVPVAVPDAPPLAQVTIAGLQYINATAKIGGATPSDPALVYHAEYRQVDPGTHAPLGAWAFMPTDISQWVRQSGAVTVGAAYEVHGWFVLAGTPSAMSASSFITIL